jgi:LuxR family quorum sensing-dependent transcriptional regulator
MNKRSRPYPTISADDLLGCTALMARQATADDLRDCLATFLAGFGFKGFTLAVVRRVKSLYLHARMLSTWSAAMQSSFEQERLFNSDPVIIRSRTALEPFVWDLSIYRTDDPVQVELRDFRKQNFVSGGVCIPLAEAFQGRCVLYLSGDGFAVGERTLLILQLLAQHLCVCFNRLNSLDKTLFIPGGVFQSDGELSPRERQVFGWIAFGKSSKDIALIMAISEHTVNDYIASAVAKLKASNRTEALLRAFLTNQVDLT